MVYVPPNSASCNGAMWSLRLPPSTCAGPRVARPAHTHCSAMILIAFRHGLRASELCELQWSDVEFETATIHLRRAKGGAASTHPLLGDELRALRALKREAKSPFMFVTERGTPFSVSGLAKLIERAGVEAKLPFPVHAHMLRHACGYALANKGTDTRTLQAYLGHRSIQSTVRYSRRYYRRFCICGGLASPRGCYECDRTSGLRIFQSHRQFRCRDDRECGTHDNPA